VPRPFPGGGSAANRPAPPPLPPTDPQVDISAPEGSVAAPRPGAPGLFDGYALVGTALSLRGTPYRNGGTDTSGFDCSGFTQFVFSRYGIALPRDVHAQYQVGRSVAPQDLSPGDLVFFATSRDVSHVAIVVGGDEFVHAPSSSGVVRVEHLTSTYWSQRYVGARRVTN
jgi:cell wall-associated NlpC family hydrolase